MKSRLLLGALFAVSFFMVELHAAESTQKYPDHPVRIIVAYPPGGTLDTLSRIIAQKLSETWNQAVQPNDGTEVGDEGHDW